VIARYVRPQMGEVWSDAHRLELWLDVELAVTAVRERQGAVPAGTTDRVRSKANIDESRMLEIEARVHHDVIAFLSMITESAGDDARHLHVGMTSSDLVDAGLVKSFAHPGGNITGINDLSDELAAKRLELLNEALPGASRVALLLNPNFPATPKIAQRVGSLARTLGIELIRVDAQDPASLDAALDSFARSRPDAILLGGDALFVVRAKELVARSNAMQIPLVHYWPGTAEMGALISHQADIMYNVARAAYYADRILKGAKPGELPIEQPSHYELVVNARIAKAFGIELPARFLQRADRVID